MYYRFVATFFSQFYNYDMFSSTCSYLMIVYSDLYFNYFKLSIFLIILFFSGSVCGGECCGDEAEDILRKQGQKDFATLLNHNSRSTQGLLSFTAATLQSKF